MSRLSFPYELLFFLFARVVVLFELSGGVRHLGPVSQTSRNVFAPGKP